MAESLPVTECQEYDGKSKRRGVSRASSPGVAQHNLASASSGTNPVSQVLRADVGPIAMDVAAADSARRKLYRNLVVAGGVLRAILIAVAAVQDAMAEVAYTDIDYRVFSEAAESVRLGMSPYSGRTQLLRDPETKYRYSPLLAYVLLPNLWLHACWGKILFSALDLVAAWPLIRLLSKFGNSELVKKGLLLLLFNPFTFTISTRGSCESIVTLFVYLLLDALLVRRNLVLAGAFFGLLVHLRIYPVIYALPLLFFFGNLQGSKTSLLRLISSDSIRFSFIAAGVFFGLLGIFSGLYGWDFLMETYLYHGSRVDTKHNFSVYFYPLRWFPTLARLSLLPQLAAVTIVGWTSSRTPPAQSMLLQTLAFVSLNRVVTAQYFVWWLSLIPVSLPWLRLDMALVKSLAAWAVAEVHWLCWAYLLEFRQWPVAIGVWIASWIFMLVQFRLIWLLQRSRPLPTS